MVVRIKSYKMSIVPFCIVPSGVVFRYNKGWWRRSRNSKREIEKFVCEDLEEETRVELSDDALVAMAYCKLKKEADKLLALDTFNVCLK